MIYGGKIVQDFKEGKLDSEGNPLEPSPMERLSSEEVLKKTQQIFRRLKPNLQALRLSRQTGSDVFSGGIEPSKTWNLDWKVGKTNN